MSLYQRIFLAANKAVLGKIHKKYFGHTLWSEQQFGLLQFILQGKIFGRNGWSRK